MTALKTQPLQPPKITFKQMHQQSLNQLRNTNPPEHSSNEPKQIMYSQTLLLDGCRSDSNPYPSDSSISLQLPSSREITPSNDSSSRYQTHVTESPDSGMESSLDHDSETWKSRENSTTILNSISSVSSKSSDMVGKSQRRGNTFEDVENFSSEIVDLRHPNSVETENGNQEVNNSISDDNSSPGNESDTIAPSSPVLVNNSYSMYAHRSPKRKLSSVGPEESPSPVSSKLDDCEIESGSLKDDVEMDGDCSDMEMMYNSLEIDEEQKDQNDTLSKGPGIESKPGRETTDDDDDDEDDDVIDDAIDEENDNIESPESVLEIYKSKTGLLNQGLNINNNNKGDGKISNLPTGPTQKMTIPIKCAECNHSFHSNASYAIHQRKHTGERPFVCDECGLGFTQKGNLSRHKQTHQDSKPFKCDQCNYATKRKDALITHKSTHYLNKRYKCTYCSQAYKQRQSLRDHLRACHRVPNSELRDVLSESVTPIPASVTLGDPSHSPTPSNTPSSLIEGGYSSSNPSPLSQGNMEGHSQKFRLLDPMEQRKQPQMVDIKNNLQRLPPIDVGARLTMNDRGLTGSPLEATSSTLKRASGGSSGAMGGGGYQPISPPNVATTENSLKDLLRNANNNTINNPHYMNSQLKLKNEIINQYNRSQQAAGMLRGPILGPSASSHHNPSSAGVPSSLARPLPPPHQVDVDRYLSGGRVPGNGYPHTRPSQMYPLGPGAPTMTPAVQQLNALAAAYNLPYLRSASHNIPTSVNSAATAIAYSHHQLEAAKRIQGIRAQLPPLIKPQDFSVSSRLRQPDIPLASEANHPGSNPANGLDASPGSSAGLPKDCGHLNSLGDQKPGHRGTLDLRSEGSASSSSCLSCQSALKCETCCIIFNDNVMYTIHLGLHSKMDPLKCNLCGFLASNRYEFASHIARGDHRQLNPTPKNSPVL